MLQKQAKRLIRHFSTNNYQTLNWIELDHRRVLANLALVQEQHPRQAIIPVLKGNAYGHGLAQMTKILNASDCAFLAVDGYFEAAQIRDITRHRILVMGYIKPENARLLDTKRCSFVVQDIPSLQAFGALNRPVRIHMELNTGMHRLGLQTDEVDEYLAVLKQYPKLRLEGVMTHLADADNPTSRAFTVKQSKLFDQAIEHIIAQGFEPIVFHIAQTARSRYANALRLGIGLYGINPLSPLDKHFQDLSGLQPVLQLKSTIIKTYHLKKGDRVSYNGIFTAPVDMRIGILPLGYYEGVPRELSNRGFVTNLGKALPIVGKVCMNHTIIDITDTRLEVDSLVTVISKDSAQPNSAPQLAVAYDLFSYSLLTALSSSIKRVIV